MTPLAAKLFRTADEDTQRRLASAQFFECTALTPLALEMRKADDAESGFSSNAQLPAPKTLIEILLKGERVAFFCQQHEEGHVSVHALAEQNDGHIHVSWRATFTPGSGQISIDDVGTVSPDREAAATIGLIFVEKFLCIINQPGLVERRARDTDKRVMREAKARSVEQPAPKWHECYIRPGVHGSENDGGESHREHKLHYVRKHRKPSLGPDRWIDGYWRGNADLGIYHKYYMAKASDLSTQMRPT